MGYLYLFYHYKTSNCSKAIMPIDFIPTKYYEQFQCLLVMQCYTASQSYSHCQHRHLWNFSKYYINAIYKDNMKIKQMNNVKILYLQDMRMLEVSFVKDKEIAKCSSYQVQKSTANIRNDVQTQQLPKNIFFWPTGWINVRSKKVTICVIQHYIHAGFNCSWHL